MAPCSLSGVSWLNCNRYGRGSVCDERTFTKMHMLPGDQCGRLTKNPELCLRFAEHSDIRLSEFPLLEVVAVVLRV